MTDDAAKRPVRAASKPREAQGGISAGPDQSAPADSLFMHCPAAEDQLRRRWGVLRSEGRFEQLAWEAKRISAREPGWALARNALCLTLIEIGRCAEARQEAAKGAAVCPQERVMWQQLQRRADELQAQSQRQSSLMPPPSSRRARVVVASLFCGEEFALAMRPARENHARWCALHGYTYACFEENIAGRPDPTWSKIPFVLRLLREGAEFVFWMDADSLFIHDGVDLQWACDLDRDFVFAGDLNVVFNAGHFLARRGAWVEAFLEAAFRIYPWPHWEDNGAMMIMLGGGSADKPDTWMSAFDRMKVPTQTQEDCLRAMRELLPSETVPHVAVVPQHRLNAYEWPGGGGIAAIVRGDPILHFAGCSAAEKPALVSRFAACTGDPKDLVRFIEWRRSKDAGTGSPCTFPAPAAN